MKSLSMMTRLSIIVFSFFISLLLLPDHSFGLDSLCAEVKIEISQELTLERQAFDAHMRINNGLANISLDNVAIVVNFTDEDGSPITATFDPNADPEATGAKFWISVDSMENISDVNGQGTVAPSTSADIHWLIIPVPGAADSQPAGKLYYVGATLTYDIGGEENVTEVTPDYIYVKPLPDMALDYFIPSQVYGDDAFTTETEPPVPFSLGLRVKNTGAGTARNMKIDSAQPKIVENEHGLLIGFNIQGSEVNGSPKSNSLLVEFGDIAPDDTAVARWIMTCTLSGEFISFTASISHSDELGGELTSLIPQENVNTHFLVNDVIADNAGNDTIKDFLAKYGTGVKLFESNGDDSDVTDISSSASLALTGSYGTQLHYTLSITPPSGFIYLKMADPQNGAQVLKGVVRSDGKNIKSQNAWLSKTRKANPADGWDHYINLFDVDPAGSYNVVYDDPGNVPFPPVIAFIPNRTGAENQTISFLVQASDPNGTIPALSAESMPVGATFVDQGDGTGLFEWTPAIGQAGEYSLAFRAFDGALEDVKRTILLIYPYNDTDGDGMDDDWEMANFGTLDRDGTGDYDGDGISDLLEFQMGTNPLSEDHPPTVPAIQSPTDADVAVLSPALTIENSTDPDGDTITYEFEVFTDATLTEQVAAAANVAEGTQTTSWSVPVTLNDNTSYVWRVRAHDGIAYSLWAYTSFFVNTANNVPSSAKISYPANNTEVSSLTPMLQVTAAADIDLDALTYAFEVYSDTTMTNLVTSASGITENGATASWTVDQALTDNTDYYWRVTVTDEHGAQAVSDLAIFTVNTSNTAPPSPYIISPQNSSSQSTQPVIEVANVLDADDDPLTYVFELDTIPTFDSPAKQVSGPIPEGIDTTTWQPELLKDNTVMYIRVKASDGSADSPWTVGSFVVNTINDAPASLVVDNPGLQAWVTTLTPTLTVADIPNSDQDILTWHFEIYRDAELTDLAVEGQSSTSKWVVPTDLDDNTWYFWRAQVEDDGGLTGPWMTQGSFFVKNHGVDLPPEITINAPGADIFVKTQDVTIAWQASDPDSDAQIAIFYATDESGTDAVLIQDNISEDAGVDSITWNVSAVPEGTYVIYARISDETTTIEAATTAHVTVDRTSPFLSVQPQGGFLNAAQDMTLTASEAVDIYYTTNGVDPDTTSMVYTAPIQIDTDITINAFCLDPAGNQSSVITATYIMDTDSDFMADFWEIVHFGDLSHNGTLDSDNDGLTDLKEYQQESDPNISNAPSIPVIAAPQDQAEVFTLQPDLTIENSTDPDGDAITYLYEIYNDSGMTNLLASASDVALTEPNTSWTVSVPCADNTWYYWRVRATDTKGFSEWATGSFFANTVNDAPAAFNINSPMDKAEVTTLTPTLVVTNSSDVERDTLTYSFTVYQDSDLTMPAAQVTGVAQGNNGTTSWTVDTSLNDNTWYYWQSVVTDEHGLTNSTSVGAMFVNTVNDAPESPIIVYPNANTEVETLDNVILSVFNAVDVDEDEVTYVFELDVVSTFDSAQKQTSGQITEGSLQTTWTVTNLTDNTVYYWRVRASDGDAQSPWVTESFFVNTANDPPSGVTLKNPDDLAWVAAVTPTLEVNPATDIDRDTLTYTFEVYEDSALTALVVAGQSPDPQWVVSQTLTDNVTYYWRARAVDEHEMPGAWMDTAAFFTDSNGVNDTPTMSITAPAADIFIQTGDVTIAWQDSDPETDATIALFYAKDASGTDAVLIQDNISEDSDVDSITWDVSAVAEGSYVIYAKINDTNTSSEAATTARVTVDRTSPTLTSQPQGGFLNAAQGIALIASEPADIYYTINGTDPNTTSMAYTAPIQVAVDMTIKAFCVDRAGNTSGIITSVYIMDTDNDLMADSWEIAHFGDLSHDGTQDSDNDGLTDLEEYQEGKNPNESNAPSIPVIFAPQDQTEVTTLQPDLTIENSIDPDGDAVTYIFEIYNDEGMTDLLASASDVALTEPTTSWMVSAACTDNAWHYWRVRATDAKGFSEWAYGSFFANTQNDPPGAFNISSPMDKTEVTSLTPTLAVTNSSDVDLDVMTYSFTVYEDSDLSIPVAQITGVEQGDNGTTSWTVDTILNDNAWYYWQSVVTDEHGLTNATSAGSMFVNTINDAPQAPQITSPTDNVEVNTVDVTLIAANATDLDEDTLTYFFEIDVVNTFDSAQKQTSGEITEGFQQTTWSVTSLTDNTVYYWRVKASDGATQSTWVMGSFFVNTANDPPSGVTLKNPGDQAWVATVTPTVEVHPATDVDRDTLTYVFEVYEDNSLTTLVVAGQSPEPQWVVSQMLTDNVWYFWRARAVDEHGVPGAWMDTAAFFTDSNGINDTPEIHITAPAQAVITNAVELDIAWEDADPDNNAAISLYYDTDLTGADGVLIVSGIEEDPDGAMDTYTWDTSALPDGVYYLYAVIDDGNTSTIAYSASPITIDRTPPVVTVSIPGGYYITVQEVELWVNEPAVIYYTVDGTDPFTGSPVYDTPFEIGDPTILKAVAVDIAGNLSDILEVQYDIQTIPGDLNNDGVVDRDDFEIILHALWSCEGDSRYVPAADYTGDGCIRGEDLITWLKYYINYLIQQRLEEALNGDLDEDGDVDWQDRSVIKRALGSCIGDVKFIEKADYDDDGCITKKDYKLWVQYFVDYSLIMRGKSRSKHRGNADQWLQDNKDFKLIEKLLDKLEKHSDNQKKMDKEIEKYMKSWNLDKIDVKGYLKWNGKSKKK